MTVLSILLSTLGVIFAVIDPFGYVPLFLTMTATNTVEQRRIMLRKACLTAFAVLLFFTVLGNHILTFFGISIPALQISGGLILLGVAFEMLKMNPVGEKLSPAEESEAEAKEDISIVPLAIPMLSGPSSIVTVMVLGSKSHQMITYPAIVLSVALVLAFTYFVLQYADRILGIVGITGINVVTRVMGFLLCAMAVQFIINGYVAIRS